jgi:N-acetylated-alpha-linked acidic dipeptidase
MSRPSAGRRLSAAAICGIALACAAPASAQQPILGFTDSHAEHQQAYEGKYQDGVRADVIGQTSRALSRRPQLVGTDGARRSFEYSVDRLRSYGLDVSTRQYSVYSSSPRDVSVTMTAPQHRQLATIERGGFPWESAFGEVVEGYNAFSPSGDVSGEVVYANYGLPQDYAALDQLGVSVKDKIVLVR